MSRYRINLLLDQFRFFLNRKRFIWFTIHSGFEFCLDLGWLPDMHTVLSDVKGFGRKCKTLICTEHSTWEK